MKRIYLLITALVAMSLPSLAAPANVAPADSSDAIVITDNTATVSMTGYVGVMAMNTQLVTVRWYDAEIPPQPPVEYELMSVGGGIGDYSVSITGDDCFTAFIINGSVNEKRCNLRICYSPRECGTHHATLTVKCERAWYDVVITLEGTATLLKNDPVMSAPIGSLPGSSFLRYWDRSVPAPALIPRTPDISYWTVCCLRIARAMAACCCRLATMSRSSKVWILGRPMITVYAHAIPTAPGAGGAMSRP